MLTLDWLDDEHRTIACRACGESREGTLVAAFDDPRGERLTAARCAVCGSIDILDQARNFAPDDAAVDEYVEVGAGIALVAERLWNERRAGPMATLEVGCNFGFGVDFGHRVLGWTSIGIEPSAATPRGRRELGVDIRDEMLTVNTDLGARFDLVFASEVIEHVTDPVGFLVALGAHVSDDGSIFLTTPAAETVYRQADPTDALSALSPGHHVFLCSKLGAERLLTRAGFPTFRVEVLGGTLLIHATAAPELPPTLGDPFSRVTVRDYLHELTTRGERGSALRLGAAVRWLRDAVDTYQWEDARGAANTVIEAFRERYQLDLSNPRKTMLRLPESGPVLWPLVGAAYALAFLAEHEDRRFHRSAIVDYLSLSLLAAQRWARGEVLFDRDLINLWEAAASHRVRAEASRHPAHAAALAVDLLPPGIFGDQRERGDALLARLLTDLVGLGLNKTAAMLAERVEPSAERAATSYSESRQVDGRDGLYAVSVARRRSGDSEGAERALRACLLACAAATGAHAESLTVLAKADLRELTGGARVA